MGGFGAGPCHLRSDVLEQNAQLALEVADRAYVLQTGRTALEGPSREILNNQEVRAAYLGL